MKPILHEQRLSSVIAALTTLALGVVLVWWPNRSVQYLCMLLGISILAIGGVYLLGWAFKRKSGAPAFFVLPGVILVALGVWMMSSPDSALMLIQYIFGALMIVHGLVDLQGVVALIRYHRDRWWLDLLFSLITVGLGAVILYNPFGTFSTLVVLIGVALIFDGVSDLSLIIRLSMAYSAARKEQEAEQSVDEAEDEPEQEEETK